MPATKMDLLALYLFIISLSLEGMDMHETKSNLMATVKFLSEDIGQRSYQDVGKLNRAADYIEDKFRSYGCNVKRQAFTYKRNTYYNIICEVRGEAVPPIPKEAVPPIGRGHSLLVIGAHYDTVGGTPGADDNASGVAGILELARLTAKNPIPGKTIHFVAFSMEEPPAFRTKHMGSYAYAESLRSEGMDVTGMVSLEMIGYYCQWKGCQLYPLPFLRWFYPENGDFIAFVGNLSSRQFTRQFKKAFSAVSIMPIESLNTVRFVPGVDFSDHSSFWKFGYPAFMITDTAFYRNPNYHGIGDVAATLDYDRMAELVTGIYMALRGL